MDDKHTYLHTTIHGLLRMNVYNDNIDDATDDWKQQYI